MSADKWTVRWQAEAREALRHLDQHCVYPECANSRRTRGLCHGHYQELRRLTRTDEKRGTDRCKGEAELVKEGLLLPEGTGGGSKVGKSSLFLREGYVPWPRKGGGGA